MNLTYVVGVPGSGKTTLVDAATATLHGYVRKPVGEVAHVLYMRDGDEVAAQLGVPRPGFGGTDALSMSVQPKVVQWLRTGWHPEVFGEGDRLANRKFLDAAGEAGYRVTLVHVAVTQATAAERRALRGSHQDAVWLRGRETKVARLVSGWTGDILTINGELPLGNQVRELRRMPVFAEFGKL